MASAVAAGIPDDWTLPRDFRAAVQRIADGGRLRAGVPAGHRARRGRGPRQRAACWTSLQIDAAARRISFSHAVLPEAIDWLRIVNLSVADAVVDLLLTRHAYDVGITVLRREGSVEIPGLEVGAVRPTLRMRYC